MKRIICAIVLIYIIVIMGLYKMGIVLFDININSEIKEEAVILEYIKDTDYMHVYKAKIIDKNKSKSKNKNVILYVKKQDKKEKNTGIDIEKGRNNETRLEIGDVLLIEGDFKQPETQRNYGGFNYKMYLRSKNIYGSIKVNEYKKISKKKGVYWGLKRFINAIRQSIIKLFNNKLSIKNASLLRGLIIGDKSDIKEDVLESFRNASLSHILAISGAHFSYIILILNFINKKIKVKNLGNLLSILVMLFFMELTGSTTSVLRAGIMNIVVIFSKLIYRKCDFWTNLSFSLLIQMLINPYVIFDVGLQLSYLGVIGIVTLYEKVFRILKLKIISVTIAANIIIIPIMMYNFNTLSFSFIISNIFASILLGPIIILGILSVIFRFKIIFLILNILLSLLTKIADIFGSIEFLSIYVITPSIISIFLYYLIVYILFYKVKSCKKMKKVLALLICAVLIFNLNYELINAKIKQDLLINFVDVSQGDCTLIRFEGKNILIDGGGSADKNNNIGKQVLLPYLLDRKITNIDYMIFSHFDSDHAQGLMYILNKIKVRKIIIGIQKESYPNYIKLCDIVEKHNKKQKNKKDRIEINTILEGDSINIKELKLICLWPNSKKAINENGINNNSLVLKLLYGKISMLFTGDIEEIAEKEILKEYKLNQELLKSTILKVAHHGSKTSSSDELLKVVSPSIALIGVGKDNKFGHPSNENIQKFKNNKIAVYRTDQMGEIAIKVSNMGKIKIDNKIKNNKENNKENNK